MISAKSNLEVKAELSENTQKSLLRGAALILEPFGIGAKILSDKLTYYRLECLINIANKASEICNKNGIDPAPVSNKFLARFVEEASYEDNETIQNMWASLLARETNGKISNYPYISILRELNSNSVSLLIEIYNNLCSDQLEVYSRSVRKHETVFRYGGIADYQTILQMQTDMKCLVISSLDETGTLSDEVENRLKLAQKLERLGLIELGSLIDAQISSDITGPVVWAYPTFFAYDFFSAVKGEFREHK